MILGAAAALGSVWRVAELRVGVAGSVVAGLAPVAVLLGICGVPVKGEESCTGLSSHAVVIQVSCGSR